MAMAPEVEIISAERLQPSTSARPKQHMVHRFSILDSYAANYSPLGAIWYFDGGASPSIDTERLRKSFAAVLDASPLFSGRLRKVDRVVFDRILQKEVTHFNQHELWYGDDDRDPGVEFVLAKSPARLEDFLPSVDEQAVRPVWRADELPTDKTFMPQTPIAAAMTASAIDSDKHDDPCVIIQATSLACGGTVIGVKMTHLLGDALSLGQFMNKWSQAYTSLETGQEPKLEGLLYDSSYVDKVIEAAIDQHLGATSPSDSILQQAHSLPFHRYDWYTGIDPPFTSPAMSPPTTLSASPEVRRLPTNSNPMPWPDWAVSAPVSHTVIHLGPSDLRALKARFAAHVATNPLAPGTRPPSTLDLALAHLWACINRARDFGRRRSGDGDDDDDVILPSAVDGDHVYADVTLGLRARLQPALPATLMGNALAIAATGLAGRAACETGQEAAMAIALRATLERVDDGAGTTTATGVEGEGGGPAAAAAALALGAHVYGLTRETTPQRIWQTFLGRRHVLVTSWVGSGVADVRFGGAGGGRGAAFVHPVMPLVDGCVELIEATTTTTTTTTTTPAGGAVAGGRRWHEQGGLNANVYLERGAMERLVLDPELHL